VLVEVGDHGIVLFDDRAHAPDHRERVKRREVHDDVVRRPALIRGCGDDRLRQPTQQRNQRGRRGGVHVERGGDRGISHARPQPAFITLL
jgi:hypothetical protein